MMHCIYSCNSIRELACAAGSRPPKARRVLRVEPAVSDLEPSARVGPAMYALPNKCPVLSDAADSISDGPALGVLRSVLPKSLQVAAQPLTYAETLSDVASEAQLKQHHAATLAFTRLQWSAAWDSSLAQLLSQEPLDAKLHEGHGAEGSNCCTRTRRTP